MIGESREYLLNHRMDIHSGVAGSVASSGKPALIEDVRTSRQWSRVIDERLNFHTQSLMGVALSISDKVVGVVEVVNHTSETPFDENDLNILQVATRLVGLALEKVEQITLAMENK